MRLAHFEELRPICPRCLAAGDADRRLVIDSIEAGTKERVVEGILHCSNRDCQLEFLVLDGVPILLADPRAFLSQQMSALTARHDLSAAAAGVLCDAAGAGSEFESRRQHLSIYAWDAYGEFDEASAPEHAQPGAVVRCLRAGVELCGGLHGPILDVGCAAGRSTFELAAETDDLVLGVDLNFTMLRLAQGVLNDGIARYPQRRFGVVYDERRVATPFADTPNVDFWLCDALQLPFRPGVFGSVAALNLLDCVAEPYRLLNSLGLSLRIGGKAIVASPYDWSPAATPMENWLGGHSQRGPLQGQPAAYVRSLLTPGVEPRPGPALCIRAEREHLPWHTRLHDRSVMHYDVHLLALELRESAAGAG